MNYFKMSIILDFCLSERENECRYRLRNIEKCVEINTLFGGEKENGREIKLLQDEKLE